jgi:hypothetical protein
MQEVLVPVAIALIFCVLILAVCLIGILWTLVLLLPFYAYFGMAVYWVWRVKRKEAELAQSVEREAERQKAFNAQEMRAWGAALEKERRSDARREKVLRSFDKTRDPPKK